MSEIDDDPLAQALEAWYFKLECGEIPDIEEICGNDKALILELRSATDSEQILIDDVQGKRLRESADMPMTQLGEYKIRHSIGKGGMGQVFLAEQIGLGRIVALKVLDLRQSDDPKAMLRFRREAEITAALDHPNIVPIYGMGEDQGHFYIAMKWLTGPGLDEAGLELSPERIAEIGVAVARCLQQAHECGVVHRDIKPANIVLDSDKPFVVDFGLARGRTDPNLTQEGIVAGTLPYLAPEQIELKTAGHDPRTDIYALGATLYTLCTGKPPFMDNDQRRLARKIVVNEPPLMSLPSKYKNLQTIIFKAMEKEAPHRFQSAGDMAKELDNFLAGRPLSIRRVGPIRRGFRFVQRRKAFAGSLIFLLSLVVVFATLFFVNREQANRQFDSGVVEARIALQSGRRDSARAAANDLLLQRPGHTDVLELIQDIDRHDAYDRLMELVIDPASFFNSTRLEEITADCKRLDARRLNPAIYDFAAILADLALERMDQMKAKLDAIRLASEQSNSRAFEILDLIANEKPWPGSLKGVSNSADEDVVCAAGLGFLERPSEEIVVELERALSRDGAHKRTLFHYALIKFSDGDYENARLSFMQLENKEKKQVVVAEYQAHAAMLLGRLEESKRAIAKIDTIDRNPLIATIEATVFLREGKQDKHEETVIAALKRWPDNRRLLRLMANIQLTHGDIEGANETMNRNVPKRRGGRVTEEWLVAKAVVNFAFVIPGNAQAVQRLTADQSEQLARLSIEMEKTVSELTRPLAIAQIQRVRGWIALQIESIEAALFELRTGMQTAPNYMGAKVAFIDIVDENVLRGKQDEFLGEDYKRLLRELIEVCGEVIDSKGRGQDVASAAKVRDCHLARTIACHKLEDGTLVRKYAKEALPLYSDAATIAYLKSLITKWSGKN